MAKSKLRRGGKKRAGKRLAGKIVRLSQAQVGAVWQATSGGDFDGATFLVREYLPELSAMEARRVTLRLSRGANSDGVRIGSDPRTGEWAEVSTAP